MTENPKIKCWTRRGLHTIPILLFCMTALTAYAQDANRTRSITSDDFASQRPSVKSNASLKSSNKISHSKRTKSNAPIGRVTYKFIRRDTNIVKRKAAQTKPKNMISTVNKIRNKPEKVSEVGLTVWKMRPPRSSDTGIKLPVLDASGGREMWIAERVNPDTGFQAGDRVRLAIESSASGYLYVINSEIYSNGTYGDPSLIFPASLDEDNSIRPGLLVDLPDQTEDLPYFVINPKKGNYTGELLTVIISPKPLTNLKTDSKGKVKILESLIDLEENADAEIYSRTDNRDKTYSQAESEAACGAKARKQSIALQERPCGSRTRELTREEPLPQTIYRVKTNAGQPAVAFIRLSVLK